MQYCAVLCSTDNLVMNTASVLFLYIRQPSRCGLVLCGMVWCSLALPQITSLQSIIQLTLFLIKQIELVFLPCPNRMDITLTESYFFPLLAFARQYVGSGIEYGEYAAFISARVLYFYTMSMFMNTCLVALVLFVTYRCTAFCAKFPT